MEFALSKYRFFYVLLVFIYLFFVNTLIDELCLYFQAVPGYSCFTGFYNIYYIYAILILILSFFIPIADKKPSTLILNFLFLFCFIPNLIYFPKQIQTNNFELLIYTFYMFGCFLVLIFSSKYNFDLKVVKIKPFFSNIFIIFLVLMFSLIIVKDHGFILKPPNITDVYDVRENFKEGTSVLGGYAVILGGYVIAPLVILLSIIYKHKLMIYLGFPFSILLIYIIFSSSGIKSIAFSSLVIIFFYFLFKKLDRIGVGLVFFLNIFIFINFIIYKFLWSDNIVFLHWLRRLIVAPGSTASKFLEYFYINENPINSHAPLVIANYYFSTEGSANTGFFVEGVGRFGWYGLIINTFLLSFCLIFLNFFSKKVNENLLICLLVMIAYAMCNTSFLTVLFSYGLILILLLSYFLANYKLSNRL